MPAGAKGERDRAPGVPEKATKQAHPVRPRGAAPGGMEKDGLSRADQQYECVAEIGEGAYGKVFKARDLKNGGRSWH